MVVEALAEVSEILFDQQSICIDVQLKLRISNPNILFSDNSIVNSSASITNSLVESTKKTATSTATATAKRFSPSIRSGSCTDIGPRRENEDTYIQIDDLSKQLKDVYKWDFPSSFYAIFDGHGGSEASSFAKQNAMRLFFQDSDLPQASPAVDVIFDDDEKFLKQVENSNRKAFLLADQALAEECSISDYCGTTALTVLVLGRHLLIANAGDCRAVLSRKGVALQMTQDHRPSYLQEKKRVEEHGGYFEDGYLNGEIAVTRALGDRHMKKSSPLIAEPEVQQMVLSEDDDFMIIGCDGIWDVMSNQEAVTLVRRQLSQHNDPQRCATELINQALHLHTSDNLTAIVVCFSSHAVTPEPQRKPKSQPWRPRFRCSALPE